MKLYTPTLAEGLPERCSGDSNPLHWINPLLMTAGELMFTVMLMMVAENSHHAGGKKFHLQYFVGEKKPCQCFFSVVLTQESTTINSLFVAVFFFRIYI